SVDWLLSCCALLSASGGHRDLHSFPTRRSSDLWWFVQRFVCHFKAAPVNTYRLFSMNSLVNLDGIGRINVLGLHEPAWGIGTDRDQRKVKATEMPGDIGKVFGKPGITGEKY